MASVLCENFGGVFLEVYLRILESVFSFKTKRERSCYFRVKLLVDCRCARCDITIKNPTSSVALAMCKHILYSEKNKICMIIVYQWQMLFAFQTIHFFSR